jgi:putative membrane-bound dehydrogenase-like protein
MLHLNVRSTSAIVLVIAAVALGCVSRRLMTADAGRSANATGGLRLAQDPQAGTITAFRAGATTPILVQDAAPHRRPYLHAITAPDGTRVGSDGFGSNQTAVHWGFTRLNGRDFFNNAGESHWRRESVSVRQPEGDEVQWQTVYDLLDAAGVPILTETQRWFLRERQGAFVLSVEWRGQAKTDVTAGPENVLARPVATASDTSSEPGGLFLRMPWKEGAAAHVVNAARQQNERADRQRAMWVDVAVPVSEGGDLAHIAMFDYPDNPGYPQAWRVDPQLGVGTARSTAAGSWTIKKGETEVIRHQLVVYTGTLNDLELTNAWAEFSGNRSTYSTSALWGIAQREGRDAKFLSADQAVAEMSIVNGYRVNAWAAEPMVVQPMAFCWDDRGRLWVAENRDYESRVDGFSRSGSSRILILEDTDHDGVADSRKVFMEGIVFPSALAVGFDGVFVGAPPNLLFVPDRNGDDKADLGDIEVRLTGWGIRDRHEVINSLHWGPDGWLYGLQGFATESKVRKPIGKGRLYRQGDPFPEDVTSGEGVEINGGVWRYHPTKEVFEVVAHGFSNPWGIDYDAKGQLLISACVIPHLFHVIPGGIYQRQGGQHFNPYVYSDIQTIADHRHRSAHGGARVYQSDAFPASQQGRIFMANIHEHALLSDVLERKGSGFIAHHGEDFMIANNAQWIGFSVEIGPDGAVYVLDWHDSDICGNDVLHKETGRIFRIAPTASLAEQWSGRYTDLAKLTDAELVQLQTSRSDWHARRARVILQGRAARGTLEPQTARRLRDLFRSASNSDWRLRAMWALHVTGRWAPDELLQALGDADEYVRGWAIQLLAEDHRPPPSALAKFAQMARDDRSPVVRLYLASVLQRLEPSSRWSIAAPLMAHMEDAQDQNLPRLIWVGIEPLVKDNPPLALEHAATSRIPLLARFIARRSVDADAVDAVVAALAMRPPNTMSLLEGMRDGVEGRYDLAAPAKWSSVHDELSRSGGALATLARQTSQQFGDADTTLRNVKAVSSGTVSVDERRKLLQTLALQRRPQLAPLLPALLDDRQLRVDAIRAVAALDNESLGRLLVTRYSTFNDAEKAEAIRTFASRGRYGRILTEALAQGTVPRRDVPPHLARQLRRIVGPRFADVWGPVDQVSSEERAYARYRGLLNENALKTANTREGRTVFLRTCGPCHQMYGEGGSIGPDLTGSNRANLEYLLANVLNPNGEVQDAYKMVLVTTRDGRTLSGNVIAENDRQITLRMVGRNNAVISKSDIQSREATGVSMMPTGLLDSLTDREAIDLVAYLRSAAPVKMP